MTTPSLENIPPELARPTLFYHNGLELLENLLKQQDDEDEDDVAYLDLKESELEQYYRAIRAMMDDFKLTQAVAFAVASRTMLSSSIKGAGKGDVDVEIQNLKNILNKSQHSR